MRYIRFASVIGSILSIVATVLLFRINSMLQAMATMFLANICVIIGFLELYYSSMIKKTDEFRGEMIRISKLNESYQEVMRVKEKSDHSIPSVAKELLALVPEAFDELSNAKFMNDSEFFSKMNETIRDLGKGDSLAAVCGRKFWQGEASKIEEYWNFNKNAALRHAQMMRVFVPDKEDDDGNAVGFSSELQDTIRNHENMVADPAISEFFKLRKLTPLAREEVVPIRWTVEQHS